MRRSVEHSYFSEVVMRQCVEHSYFSEVVMRQRVEHAYFSEEVSAYRLWWQHPQHFSPTELLCGTVLYRRKQIGTKQKHKSVQPEIEAGFFSTMRRRGAALR